MLTLQDIEKMMKSAAFEISAAKFDQCPPEQGAEIAFAGRSNAGKSSAMNTLCHQKQLARCSKTPGRTQLINFFRLSEASSQPLKLVDLPGYGYAKVPDGVKKKWQKELNLYLEQRKSLVGIMLLMDIRHPFSEFDNLLLNWAVHHNMPVHVLLTKCDKLKRGAAKAALMKVAGQLTALEGPFSVQLFSSTKKEGIEDAYQMVGEFFQLIEVVE